MYVRAFQQEIGISWWLENDRSWHVNCMWAKNKSYPVNKLYKIVYWFFCVDLSIVKPCITGKLSSRAFRKCTLLLCSDNCIKVLGDFPVGVKYLGKDKFLKSCEKTQKMWFSGYASTNLVLTGTLSIVPRYMYRSVDLASSRGTHTCTSTYM